MGRKMMNAVDMMKRLMRVKKRKTRVSTSHSLQEDRLMSQRKSDTRIFNILGSGEWSKEKRVG
jgi:hypothetical protein